MLSSERGPRSTAQVTISTSWRSTAMRSSTQRRRATRRASSTTAATQTARHRRLGRVFFRGEYKRLAVKTFGHAGEIIRLCVTAY